MFESVADRPTADRKSRRGKARSGWTVGVSATLAILLSAAGLFLAAPIASATASASHCRARHTSRLKVKSATLRATIVWRCQAVKVSGSFVNRSGTVATAYIGSGKVLFAQVSSVGGRRTKIDTGWWATHTPETIADTVTLNVVVYTQPPTTAGVAVHRHMAR